MDNRDFFLACCPREHGLLRKIFAAVPEEMLDWRPEPKARSSRQLIGHMIGHEQDLLELVDDGVIHHRNVVPFETLAEALELFDQASTDLETKSANMDDDAWNRVAQMWFGPNMILEAPAGEIMWGFIFDSIHHRGQLSTYLRPMGSKVPAMYGPSADEPGH